MSYYKVLGLNADADVETIRKAASIRRVALEDTELFLNTLHQGYGKNNN